MEALKLFGDRGFGAMITFDFAGRTEIGKKRNRDGFIKAVSEKIKIIPSLGDPKTILMPVESVWGAKYPEPGMIRLSVGFEIATSWKKPSWRLWTRQADNDSSLYLQSIGSMPFVTR
jgi:O-acetylhomoserine/O-acetylserine sulfhydrylase-like pyridoxal-dependent enzyme